MRESVCKGESNQFPFSVFFSCLSIFLQRNQNKLVVMPRFVCICMYVSTCVSVCVLGAKKVSCAVAFVSVSFFFFSFCEVLSFS